MNFISAQVRNFFTNRFGLTLMFANLVLAVYALWEKGWNYKGFHWHYESAVMKILALLNLPASIFGEITTNLIFSPLEHGFSMKFFTVSEMAFVIFFSIIQWLLIGYLINLGYLASREKIK